MTQRLVNAVYVFRQTVDVINYLVGFHGFNVGAFVVCVSVVVTCMLVC
ncbi:MAG: hypothetical protein L7H00_03450 [Vulcanisaeta sp.]|nr:hypothetical protein [Vulcanisaeta sp.]MCG2892570.1 hypothetical protein [Vulcanisaeta sp.]MCG2894947.1 hypothetical protein [Vulcanisaeta sp.]